MIAGEKTVREFLRVETMKNLILLLLVVMTLTGCGKIAQNDRETAILYTGKDHLTARETVDAWLRKEI